jgi:LuxR family transcriptional regulator, maltose regulon positive regulatory protein
LDPPAERFAPPLIKTKLAAPRLRADLVSRPQLLERLLDNTACALTLICAPAGYGKTTLLVNWIAELNRVAGPGNPLISWLSLDQADNDPPRFLNYLISTVNLTAANMGKETAVLLQVPPHLPFQTVLTFMINDLERFANSVYLVLDDYQTISNTTIHEGMAFFLEHIPCNVHLVIATRSDPPIPMARLRARRQMTEIRADDLRFNYQETRLLFNNILGYQLTPDDAVCLADRTEGWIAGLQMAGLALKSLPPVDPADTSVFIRNFAGSHRYILDYLAEEVLAHQPEEIQDFLLQTSILENLSSSLCDAVTGRCAPGSDAGSRSSQSILEFLDRSNLFLVSLDSERLWYRYHHLFADLLRARLEQRSPKQMPELHLRASTWLEHNQHLPEAVNHALDALDFARACRLIEVLVGKRLFDQAGIGLLLGWIRRLPQDIVCSHPWLCIVQATSAMFLNDVEKIEPLLQTAEKAIQCQECSASTDQWKGQIANLRAFVADVHNDIPGTIQMVEQALKFLQPEDAATRTYAKYLLGRAYFLSGVFSKATATLTENVQECIQANVTDIVAPSLSGLSKIYRIQGRLQDSIEPTKYGQTYIEKCDPRRVTVAGLAYIGQANLLREWNELEQAETITRKALALCEPWVNPSSTAGCYTLLARILMDQGKFAEAGQVLNLAAEAIRGRMPLAEVISDLNAARVAFWLASSQLSTASHWAQQFEQSLQPNQPFSIPGEQDQITLARVHLAEGKIDIAHQALGRLAGATQAGGRIGSLLEIQILDALAFQALRERNKALDLLQSSLALAEPEGYVRIFIDEGQPLQELLLVYVHVAAGKQISYAQKLLGLFPAPAGSLMVTPPSTSLVEALTPREIEVLQAMGQGLSNHEIAEKYILADGTVKFYVHAVLEKLGVHNRTQAVIEAKNQKII